MCAPAELDTVIIGQTIVLLIDDKGLQPMADENDDNEKSGWNLKIVTLGVVALIVAAMALNVVLMNYLYTEPGDRGTAGDQFGGVTALFSGLAFAGLIITLLIQRKELELQRTELKASNKEFALQRFDSAFFGVIKMLNDHVSSITHGQMVGRPALQKISEALKNEFLNEGFAIIAQVNEDDFLRIKKAMSQMYEVHDAQLGPYFRILHNIFRLIESEKQLSAQQKNDYGRIARAHISLAELDLIFLNGVTEQAEKFKPLIERYAILKHITYKTRSDYRMINDRYDVSAFAGRELPPPTATKSPFSSRK